MQWLKYISLCLGTLISKGQHFTWNRHYSFWGGEGLHWYIRVRLPLELIVNVLLRNCLKILWYSIKPHRRRGQEVKRERPKDCQSPWAKGCWQNHGNCCKFITVQWKTALFCSILLGQKYESQGHDWKKRRPIKETLIKRTVQYFWEICPFVLFPELESGHGKPGLV